MLTIVAAFLLIGIFSSSLFGWGIAFKRLAKMDFGNVAVTVMLGFALWIFIGGILNLLRLAYPIVLDSMVVSGFIFFLFQYKVFIRNIPRERTLQLYALTFFIMTIAIIGFVISTLLPPDAYNFHDDYEKYFSHPVRMLQTGTLFGSALSAMGSQTMGAQAFLHGFILNHFSVEMLNGFDLVFCLFLCLILIGSIAWKQPSVAYISILSMLIVFLINPQYVNVSALYSASALVITLVLYMELEQSTDVTYNTLTNPMGLSLIYSALAALKMTFIPFVTLHFIVTIISMSLVIKNKRLVFQWGGQVILWGAIFLSPWLLLHAPHYLLIFGSAPKKTLNMTHSTETLNVFSTKPLFYGSTYLHYTLIAIGILLIGIYMLHTITKNRDKKSQRAFISLFSATISGSLAYFLLIIFMGPIHAGYSHALRYSIPILIGLSAVTLPVLSLYLTTQDTKRYPRIQQAIIIAIALSLILSLLPSAIKRIEQARENGSILSFSAFASSKNYIGYNTYVLKGKRKEYIQILQKKIPSNTKILAWISTPFYLDYSRNEIVDVEPMGLQSPWAIVNGVNYVLWEYKGFAVRLNRDYDNLLSSPGKFARDQGFTSIKFLKFLIKISKNENVIYNDGHIIIVKVNSDMEFKP